MIYLASPYSHPEARVREERVRLTAVHAADMMRIGRHVFAPIVHGHSITEHWAAVHPEHLRPHDEVDLERAHHAWWMAQCMAFLRHASELVVLKLAGWEESIGIKLEVRLARELGIHIRYRDPWAFYSAQTFELMQRRAGVTS